MPHIAEVARIDNLPEFYRPAFPSPEAAREFCVIVQNLPPEQNAPKIVLHQTARMLWLADQIDQVARGRPAFQILFHLITAELIAKVVFNFEGEGQSRRYVHRFFGEICSGEHRSILARAFRRSTGLPLSWEQAVDVLYDVRCDVVHRGSYYTFLLPIGQEDFPMLTIYGEKCLEASLRVTELRQIVLEGAVLSCRILLP